ncbi:hypothetical protein ACFLYP_04310, partial [Chloroflexota bacterium]
LATRADLFKDQPDHPRAREEYFKLQLGSLVALPDPIPAGEWKRLTFLYTTGQHLLSAENLNDLTVHEEERKLLWRALRERAQQEQGYKIADLPELPIDPEILALFGLLGGGSTMEE